MIRAKFFVSHFCHLNVFAHCCMKLNSTQCPDNVILYFYKFTAGSNKCGLILAQETDILLLYMTGIILIVVVVVFVGHSLSKMG